MNENKVEIMDVIFGSDEAEYANWLFYECWNNKIMLVIHPDLGEEKEEQSVKIHSFLKERGFEMDVDSLLEDLDPITIDKIFFYHQESLGKITVWKIRN